MRITGVEVRSQESGVRSQESGVRSQESGVRSQEILTGKDNDINNKFSKSGCLAKIP